MKLEKTKNHSLLSVPKFVETNTNQEDESPLVDELTELIKECSELNEEEKTDAMSKGNL